MTGGGLTPAQVDELLRRPLLARLATLDPDGYPAIVPVWTEWDGTSVWIVARARAAFLVDLRRDPRVCVSVVDDADPDRRVRILGRAETVGPEGPLAGRMLEIARRMAERYEGPPGLAYIERSRDLPRALVRVVPERIVSWGSPDWHPRYASSVPSMPAGPARRAPDLTAPEPVRPDPAAHEATPSELDRSDA